MPLQLSGVQLCSSEHKLTAVVGTAGVAVAHYVCVCVSVRWKYEGRNCSGAVGSDVSLD